MHFFLIGHADKNTIDLSKLSENLNILIFLSKKNWYETYLIYQ